MKTLERARAALPTTSAPPTRLLFVVGIFAALAVVAIPARQLVAQRAHISLLERRVGQLATENRQLEAEVARLQDPEQLELEARARLGVTRPGEQSYLFVPPPEAVTAPAAQDVERPNVLVRLWRWIAATVRGSG